MSAENYELTSSLLALAVDGEECCWLGELRSKQPLPDDWRHADIFWLYPVEGASIPTELEGMPFFDPTDLIYELRKGDQHSRVVRSGTLLTDVTAKRLRVGARLLFLVSTSEARRVDSAFQLFLKKEAELKASMAKKQQVEGEKTETSDVAVKEPIPAAVTYDIRNGREVLQWKRFFIIHRGGVPVLCPAFRGNRRGYRLHRIIENGLSVFIFFPAGDAETLLVMPEDAGVPVKQMTVLLGEETDFLREQHVMVFTRRVGSRKGPEARKQEEIFALTPQIEPIEYPPLTEEEQEILNTMPPSILGEGIREKRSHKRQRPPKESSGTAARNRGRAKKEAIRNAADAAAALFGRATPQREALRGNLPPLTTVGVNMYTDTTEARPPVSQLTQLFGYSQPSPTSSGLNTAVLPNGSCVTYTTATANNVAETIQQENNRAQSGTHTSADDMRGLLENIKLAQEQVNVLNS